MSDTTGPAGARLDTTVLEDGIALLGGGDDGIAFLREFAETFETELSDMLIELRERIARDDADRASELAHRIKQRARTLGLVDLQEAAHRVECEPLAAEADRVQEGLRHQADAVLPALRAFLAARQGESEADGS